MHPGWADTEGVKKSIPGFHKTFENKLRTVQQGMDTVIWLALSDAESLEPGALYLDREAQVKHLFMAGTHYKPAAVDTLWAELGRMCGLAPLAHDPAHEASQAPAQAPSQEAVTQAASQEAVRALPAGESPHP